MLTHPAVQLFDANCKLSVAFSPRTAYFCPKLNFCPSIKFPSKECKILRRKSSQSAKSRSILYGE